MQLDIPVYLLLTTIVGAIALTTAILFLQRPTDCSRVDTPTHKICKPAGESEHYYEAGPEGRSGRPAVPRHLRPAAPSAILTLRAFVDQYRRTVAQLDAMNAPIPSVLTLSRMSELAALNDGYMSPISPADDNRSYSPVDDNESYRDWYIRQHDYSPASGEQSPCSVVPDNEEEPRLEGPRIYVYTHPSRKQILGTHPSRTQTGQNIPGSTTPIFKG
jgi:hypothetical protein